MPSQPNLGYYADALAYKQAKYDANREKVELEYGRLVNLELINETNKKTLQNYKNTIIPYVDLYAGNVDYSSDATTEEWINYISQPFSNAYIKDEILLLQECKRELDRLKTSYPTSYETTERYGTISKILTDLKTCVPEDISGISFVTYEGPGNWRPQKANTNSSSSSQTSTGTSQKQTEKSNSGNTASSSARIVFYSEDKEYAIINNNNVVGKCSPASPLTLQNGVYLNGSYSFSICRVGKKGKLKYVSSMIFIKYTREYEPIYIKKGTTVHRN